MKIQKYQVVIEDLLPNKQVLKLWNSIGLEVLTSQELINEDVVGDKLNKSSLFTWKNGVLTFHGSAGLSLSTKDIQKQYFNLKRQTHAIKKQPFAKALGIKNRGEKDWILDGTMGMAKDYFLASLFGFNVVGVEISQLCIALVGTFLFTSTEQINSCFCFHDTSKLLKETFSGPDFKNIFKATREYLFSTSANGDINNGRFLELEKYPFPTVIFLDPMYDEMNETALPSKTMQILRQELSPSIGDDFTDLFLTSFELSRNRVVIKRSLKAEVKFKEHFSFSCTGKSTRYDVYLKI